MIPVSETRTWASPAPSLSSRVCMELTTGVSTPDDARQASPMDSNDSFMSPRASVAGCSVPHWGRGQQPPPANRYNGRKARDTKTPARSTR